MSSFINPQFSNEHPGVNRLEAAVEGARQLSARWTPARGLMALLLTAVLAAAVTVAYEVMDTAEEGHLLALWIALWVAVFAGVALLAGSSAAKTLKSSLNAWAHRQAMARADARLWRIASTDARVMADLQNALSRADVAMLTETAVESGMCAEIPRTLTSGTPYRGYGFYI